MKKKLYIRFGDEKVANEEIDIVKRLIDPPLGTYAVSRTALHAAVGLLDKCVNGSSLNNKFDPEIRFVVPPRSFLNAFYKKEVGPTIPMEELLEKRSTRELVNSGLFKGDTNYGAILIDDGLADTYLYLSRTRRYLFDALDGKKFHGEENEKIPSDIIEEIKGLYNSWKYNSRLDLSRSLDLQDISNSARSDELTDLVFERHSHLVYMILFILSHEYGHLLLRHDEEMREKLNILARDLLIAFTQNTERFLSDDPWCKLLKDRGDLFYKWQTEISADIFGLELLRQLIPKSSLIRTLAILGAIIGICENYSNYFGIYNQDEYDCNHPVSWIRFLLNIMYLSRCGWEVEEFVIYNNIIISFIADLRDQMRL